MGSEGGDNGMFSVTVTKKEVVAAALPLQEHWLPLSNLDLLLPPLDVSVFFSYRNNNNHMMKSFGSMVGVLKKAMAQVLVSYYAFAGEVVENFVGEPEILCNNRGVDFFEAFADIDLKDLNLYNPDHCIEGKLVPKKKDGVIAAQVTELKCGGVVVACTFDHRVSDAYSANMFLVSWAETAQSRAISVVPSFRRSLLNPRRPACIDPSLDNMYVPISKLQPPKEPQADSDHLISRIYYVKADQLNELQSLASSDGYKRTKLESFSAFLWQLVAKSAKQDVAAGTAKFQKLALWWMGGREPAVAKIYSSGSDGGPAFVVSSGQRFPVSKVDFGWGRLPLGRIIFLGAVALDMSCRCQIQPGTMIG
ncbi:hypothetical protein GH714_001100 [Hevea brasiliensis]|uniref:Uncharacterized protein n=1 Tax=Hevea brasiliensis TaxID=3981 RepID=A0A6A6M677_HEVBR|nr:hypothetical protein GH714_001100 [Hevea brasiliensis]